MGQRLAWVRSYPAALTVGRSPLPPTGSVGVAARGATPLLSALSEAAVLVSTVSVEKLLTYKIGSAGRFHSAW